MIVIDKILELFHKNMAQPNNLKIKEKKFDH